ncbi:MAG: GMC family oxidoreductase [Minwuia sp.]|nr:GMC family oxidoreductase [Minwuia sp.]
MKWSFANFAKEIHGIYDYCIVGTGPAGTTLALELSKDKGKRVLLLEGGREDYNEKSQGLYTGSSSGRTYTDLDVTRLRQLGGSSNHWAGYCLPLSDHDFDRRDINGIDPWPIGSDDVRKYAEQAAEILDLPFFGRDPGKPILPGSEGLFRVSYGASSPVNFREKYEDIISNTSNIDLVLGANVIELIPDRVSGRIRSTIVANLDDTFRAELSANLFAICLGGIENPRMLLNSNSVIEGGIGNKHDLVGRYFADHLHLEFGWYVAFDPEKVENLSGGKFIEPTPGFLERHSLFNFGWEALRPFENKANDHAVADVKELACSSDIFQSLSNLLGYDIFCRRIRRPTVGRLRLVSECMPNFESRITLGNSNDIFGKRKIDLNWQIHEQDRETFRMAAMAIAQFFIQNDLGRIKVEPWVLDASIDWPNQKTHELVGNHHIGTTKMGSSPSSGVVDRNCKVFGHDNLFICGSSVFPRGGYANPTYSIVEITLHVANQMKMLS